MYVCIVQLDLDSLIWKTRSSFWSIAEIEFEIFFFNFFAFQKKNYFISYSFYPVQLRTAKLDFGNRNDEPPRMNWIKKGKSSQW